MKNNVSLVYNLCLLAGDSLALVTAFAAAYILRVNLAVGIDNAPLGPSSGKTFITIFLLVLPFWLLIFALLGLYNHSIYEKRFVEFGRLLIGSFIGLLFVVFWDFISDKSIFPARLVPIYGFAFGFIFLVIFRNVARFVRSRLFSFNVGLTHVLLVGNTRITHELLTWLGDSKESGYRVVGVVGGELAVGENKRVPLYHSFDEFLKSRGKRNDLHGIIQTELYADEHRNAKILAYAQENHISYRFVPGNTELFVGNIEVELFRNSIPVLRVHHTALFGWGRVVKRMFDLIAGGIALIIASPIMLLLACIIKITEPRAPILFKPIRTGRYGNSNPIYKFRTMKQTYSNMSPEDGFTKMGKPELIKEYRANGDQLTNDPRVTVIGRFMRKTSLDELPQLINIVKGDISLVGPRALDPFELDQYSKKNLILAVKTGLTGLAQVSGRRNISFEERRKLDLYYVQNWSFWMDIVILVKTVRVVLGGRGTN
jgi:exopolysaccharide biosynthesis polyprenyl glycosylphosphotransferase